VRADDEMLLVLMSIRSTRDVPPVIHLRRHVDGGLFDRLADDFDDNWHRAAPLTSPEQMDAYLADTELESAAVPEQADSLSVDAPSRAPEAPTEAPRHWP
jgi:hypothetical protein